MSYVTGISLCLLVCLLQDVSSLPGGTVYTRWGRTVCPTGATEVYKGQMAGAWYNQVGGAANHLCLPEVPQWGAVVAGDQASAQVYGVEYHFNGEYGADNKPFSWENTNFNALYDHEAPCVVCFNPSRNHQLMIPARVNCSTDGWNTEYTGYLVSDYYGHRRSEYICLDRAPEILVGSNPADQNGRLILPVQTDCASMVCPPYASGSEVACAVCSK